MVTVKHKIISGFPCNNKMVFTVITEDFGTLTTTDEEAFNNVMKDGYLELEHEDYYCKENVL